MISFDFFREKNGDEPGPLGDFVMWLVTKRTKKKENQTKKKEKENRKLKPVLFLQKMSTLILKRKFL